MNFKMKVVSNVQVTVAYVVQYLYTYEYMQSCLSFLTSRRLKSNPFVSKSCTLHMYGYGNTLAFRVSYPPATSSSFYSKHSQKIQGMKKQLGDVWVHWHPQPYLQVSTIYSKHSQKLQGVNYSQRTRLQNRYRGKGPGFE